jgi:hypothetical protein
MPSLLAWITRLSQIWTGSTRVSAGGARFSFRRFVMLLCFGSAWPRACGTSSGGHLFCISFEALAIRALASNPKLRRE